MIKLASGGTRVCQFGGFVVKRDAQCAQELELTFNVILSIRVSTEY